MPFKTGKYVTKETSKGPIRLHYTKAGVVNEAVNLKTKARHTPAEFKADRLKAKKKK